VGAGAGYYHVMVRPNMYLSNGISQIRIPYGTRFDMIVDSLDAAGLHSRRSFELVARVTGWGDQIKAGNYVFTEQKMSNYDIYRKLRLGEDDPVRVRVPAGAHPTVIADSVARNMAFDAETFLTVLRDPVLAEELGTDTQHLFSYMLPDTYFFSWLTEAEHVVRYIKKRADDLFIQADSFGNVSLTREEILSLASIVELETYIGEEKTPVAGVYINRFRQGWPLQADPTVQYGIIELEGQKRTLRVRDYQEIDHPYNTYLYPGIPPPIANPSDLSILGVIHYAAWDDVQHDYMFFVASPEGGHAFNQTLDGHNRDVAIWREHLQELREKQRQATDHQN